MKGKQKSFFFTPRPRSTVLPKKICGRRRLLLSHWRACLRFLCVDVRENDISFSKTEKDRGKGGAIIADINTSGTHVVLKESS